MFDVFNFLLQIEDRKDAKHYIELEPLPKTRTETKPITIQSKCLDDDGRVKRTGSKFGLYSSHSSELDTN